MSSKAQKRPVGVKILIIVVLAAWMAMAAIPFLWTLWGSFKVEGDFFSKADWANAIYGTLTQTETGSKFTGGGYNGAWIQEEFWRAAIQSIVVCFFVVINCPSSLSF